MILLMNRFHNTFYKIINCPKVDSAFFSSSQVSFYGDKITRSQNLHEYQKIWQHKTLESTSKYLLKHVIYNENGIVCINKPPGLGSSRTEPSIYYSLPFLAQELGYKNLNVASIPDKHISGLTILAAETEAVKKAIRRSKAIFQKPPKKTYLAVTVGHPIDVENPQCYGIREHFHNNKRHYVMLTNWGKNEVKRREVHYGIVAHEALDKSDFTSLVSISTWQEKCHFPRVFLSDVLISPALGDAQYSQRASSLLGKRIVLKPWTAPAVKALEPTLLKTLNLLSGSEGQIPLHFHLHELVLHGFLKDKKHLVLRADPPDYFRWTCKKLDLEMPKIHSHEQENLEEDDAITTGSSLKSGTLSFKHTVINEN